MLSSLSLEISSVADITHILKILYQFIGPTYSLIVQFEPSIDWCHGGRQKKTCTWNGGLPTYHPLLTTTRIIGWLYIYIYLFTCCTCTYFRTYIYIHNIHIYIYMSSSSSSSSPSSSPPPSSSPSSSTSSSSCGTFNRFYSIGYQTVNRGIYEGNKTHDSLISC